MYRSGRQDSIKGITTALPSSNSISFRILIYEHSTDSNTLIIYLYWLYVLYIRFHFDFLILTKFSNKVG